MTVTLRTSQTAQRTAAIRRFVPDAEPPTDSLIQQVQALLDSCKRLTVLTGAGLSTESGIPDYRSPKVGQYARTKHRPTQHNEFMSNEYLRRRYWTRNFVAWGRFNEAPFNSSHKRLADWEKTSKFNWLITQNVDGLHSAAGSTKLTELHGCAKRVVCMSCGKKQTREQVQEQMTTLNPNWTVEEIGELRPDGDVEIPESALLNFRVPYCTDCGERSIMKTDVVFFGDNVKGAVVDECYSKVEDSDCMLVLGSSLMVLSGLRFVHHAAIRRVPTIIVNVGETRADAYATIKVEALCSEVLERLQL